MSYEGFDVWYIPMNAKYPNLTEINKLSRRSTITLGNAHMNCDNKTFNERHLVDGEGIEQYRYVCISGRLLFMCETQDLTEDHESNRK